MSFHQSGEHLEGFSQTFLGDSTIISRNLDGTITGSMLRGTYSESLTFYLNTRSSDSGNFEGTIISPDRFSSSVADLESTSGGAQPNCRSLSITFTR
jgi:hypothetical protein